MTGDRRILVVDDDADVRAMVRAVLEAEGYAVDTANDGFAALRAVDSTAPDCVVLDVMMPGMDGHGVLTRIRAGARAALPVVMLTAAADDSQAWQAWTEGVDYFLAKPFEPEELLRFLDYLFQQRSITA
ncbi:MAG TPA: response regulator transcription factor [Frankiaceae bacterium]|jgi:DNA-binding response OmpR family regulator|nr:response regulator transcription factor [Frankiaceae bacterium]